MSDFEAKLPAECRATDSSTAGALRVVTELAQFLHDTITVIALDFDDALLDGATGPAELLQSSGKLLEFYYPERKPVNDRNTLTGATGHLTADAHESRAAPHG